MPHAALLSFSRSLDSQLFCQNYIYSETNCLINWYNLSSHLPETPTLRILMLEIQCVEQRGIGDLNTATFDDKFHSLMMPGKRSIWNGFSFQGGLCMWVAGPSTWRTGFRNPSLFPFGKRAHFSRERLGDGLLVCFLQSATPNSWKWVEHKWKVGK